MKQFRFLLLLWIAVFCFASCEKDPQPVVNNDDIVILYESDAHCSIDGYPVIAGLCDWIASQTPYVSVVSSGDFLSGSVMGAISHGSYIVRLMNAVGYDYVTIGNHEFDFRVPNLMDRLRQLDAHALCCNFVDIASGKQLLDGYEVRRYGNFTVAFVGVTTPTAMTTSSPVYFQDDFGNWAYSFCQEDLAARVQRQVDAARREGASIVVLLSHLGERMNASTDLIGATEGIDVVLDGHSHTAIPECHIPNRNGDLVLLSNTGTAFKNIGKLTIAADGTISTELLEVSQLNYVSRRVRDSVEKIKEEYTASGNRHVGSTEFALSICDAAGTRIVRNRECNIGDFCADAFRINMQTQIGLCNGGGIRTNIDAGEITFNDLYSVFPFNNKACVVSTTGEDILNALEMACSRTPGEFGGFLQVSGLRFSVDTTIASGVVTDANGLFLRVEGERRVKGVEVLNGDGSYSPLNIGATYTVAASSYVLLNMGDGICFPHATLLREDVCSEVEVLERFLTENLHGVVGENYRFADGRIVIGTGSGIKQKRVAFR